MITSMANARIKELSQLVTKAKKRRERDVFVVEGTKMFSEVPVERIKEVYVSESFLKKGECQEKLAQCSYEILADDIFAKISDTQTPQGVLCVIEQYHYTLQELLKKEAPLLLIAEDLQDPGNLGTMIRTGEGAGIDGIILTKESVDIYNPKTIRATMGSIYRVPFLYTDDLQEVLSVLKQKGIVSYAAHLKGTESYRDFSYKEGTAFLIGNEGNGLKEETADAAERYLRIPMSGKVESLNAAVAAAILMYEAAEKRKEI